MSHKVFDSLTQLIGNTPLLALPINEHHKNNGKFYAKLEFLNTSGSIKDRAVLFMIQRAIERGALKQGGTLIEASSGNTGIATAMLGAMLGYKVIITVPEKTSTEKREALYAYGAEVIVCKGVSDVTLEGSYHNVALKLHKETPNSFMLNQYFNSDNVLAHYSVTAPEIYQQTEGKITHFIAGAGSGGTIGGVSKFLKEQNPEIQIICVTSTASHAFLGGTGGHSKIEGIVVDYESPLIDKSYFDAIVLVSDDDAINAARTLARTHGVLVGLASGAVYHAAQQLDLPKDAYAVGIFGDSGRSYLSKGFYH